MCLTLAFSKQDVTTYIHSLIIIIILHYSTCKSWSKIVIKDRQLPGLYAHRKRDVALLFSWSINGPWNQPAEYYSFWPTTRLSLIAACSSFKSRKDELTFWIVFFFWSRDATTPPSFAGSAVPDVSSASREGPIWQLDFCLFLFRVFLFLFTCFFFLFYRMFVLYALFIL